MRTSGDVDLAAGQAATASTEEWGRDDLSGEGIGAGPAPLKIRNDPYGEFCADSIPRGCWTMAISSSSTTAMQCVVKIWQRVSGETERVGDQFSRVG